MNGEKVNKIKKIIVLLITLIVFVINIYFNFNYIKKINSRDYYFSKNSIYFGAIADEEIANEIEEICNYIKQQEKDGAQVKIISCYSNLYMNLLGKNNKTLDLPFHGNMGLKGEEGVIEEIKKMKGTKVLVITDIEEKHGQESEEILKFVKENLKYEGDICRFSIYDSQ